MARSTAELLAFLVVFAALASITQGLGYRGYLKPLMDRVAKVRNMTNLVHKQKTWVRSLTVRVRQSERKIKALQPALDELSSYFLRDESDRLRLSVARDHASKDLAGLTITPAEVSAPARLSFRIPVDPNEQLNRLRKDFVAENPKANFARWTVPSTIDVLRYSERITIEAPLKQIERFLMRIEAESLLLQVTELKLDLPAPDALDQTTAKATVELSALGLPSDEAVENP